MTSTSHLCRRGARYHYRRRLYVRDFVNRPITVPLGTADPVEARRLAARLFVRWETITMLAGETVTRGYLTAGEAVAIFKRGLDDELGLATAGRFDAAGDDDVQRTARVMGAAYRIAARLDPDVEVLPADLLVAHTDAFTEADRRAVVLMLKALAPQRIARVDATTALASIGAPITPTTIRDARVQILLAKAEAQDRAA